jgi:uncharacterized membrane protein HdeD (DUF308 family)
MCFVVLQPEKARISITRSPRTLIPSVFPAQGVLMSIPSPMLFISGRKSTTWSIVLSILMIIAGFLAIALPPVAGLAITILAGWLLIFSGIAHFVFAWHTRTSGGVIWEVLVGIVYVVIGVYLLWNPLMGLAALTFGLAVYLLLESILEFVLAVRLRAHRGDGWLFFDGIITLILAILIWRSWPSSTAWAIGIIVGISMLFSGISRLMLSLAARHMIAHPA